MSTERLSSPPFDPRPPRSLTGGERHTFLRVAAILVPGTGALDGFDDLAERALAARRDAFDTIVDELHRLADLEGSALETELRRAAEDPHGAFGPLSTVIAGAYLMAPAGRAAVGYPGQAARPPRFDLAADEIMDGILDPVIDRGPVFRPHSH
jgi:hypothetical protein